MTSEEFNRTYYPKYNSVIKAIARKLAKRHDDLYDELYQEGLVALWKCDVSKARDNEDAYIRQAVKFRMIDFIRKDRASRFESLNARLERGEQVALDENAEPRLIAFKLPVVRPLFEEDSRAAYSLERTYDEDDPESEL